MHAFPTLVSTVTFSKSTGFCRGGYHYAQDSAMVSGKCLGPGFTRAQCEAECARDPQCYGFDIPMTDTAEGNPSDGCCLHGAGNTGNDKYGRDCFVMSGECLKPCAEFTYFECQNPAN